MKKPQGMKKDSKRERLMIYEMINLSSEIAAKRGRHPLEKGCNCISCINKRKGILNSVVKNWRFRL